MELPDARLNDKCLQFWLFRMGWTISAPYAQWNYWHIIKKEGGILPLNVDLLIERYLSSPLSQDEIANSHRKSIYEELAVSDRP